MIAILKHGSRVTAPSWARLGRWGIGVALLHLCAVGVARAEVEIAYVQVGGNGQTCTKEIQVRRFETITVKANAAPDGEPSERLVITRRSGAGAVLTPQNRTFVAQYLANADATEQVCASVTDWKAGDFATLTITRDSHAALRALKPDFTSQGVTFGYGVGGVKVPGSAAPVAELAFARVESGRIVESRAFASVTIDGRASVSRRIAVLTAAIPTPFPGANALVTIVDPGDEVPEDNERDNTEIIGLADVILTPGIPKPAAAAAEPGLGSRVRLSQVVYDPDLPVKGRPKGDGILDLVLGKPAVLFVSLSTLRPQPVGRVVVKLALDSPAIDPTSVDCGPANRMCLFNADAPDATAEIQFTPYVAGRWRIRAVVTPVNAAHDADRSNSEADMDVDFRVTKPQRFGFVALEPAKAGLFPGVVSRGASVIADFIETSLRLIRESYPLDPEQVSGSFLGSMTANNDFQAGQTDLNILADVRALSARRGAAIDSVVGMVSSASGALPDYFAYYGYSRKSGLTLSKPGTSGASLVLLDYPSASPHELGHQLGLGLPEEYDVHGPRGRAASGFLIDQWRHLGLNERFCVMGTSAAKASAGFDREHYHHVFQRLIQ